MILSFSCIIWYHMTVDKNSVYGMKPLFSYHKRYGRNMETDSIKPSGSISPYAFPRLKLLKVIGRKSAPNVPELRNRA